MPTVRTRQPAPPTAGETRENPVLRIVAIILGIGAVVIPLTISPHGEDAFRFPKVLLLRAEGGILLILLALAWGFGRLSVGQTGARPDLRRVRWQQLVVATVAWTVIAAIFSTNYRISIAPAAHVAIYALIFALTVVVARSRGFGFAMLLIPAALVNALIYVMQELKVWTFFTITDAPEEHLRRSALIGNPNDVGAYFVAPALVAIALAMADRRRRAIWWPAAAAIVVATFATQTATAIGALVAGILMIAAMKLRDWKRIAAVALGLAVCVAIAFTVWAPLRARVDRMRASLRSGDYLDLSSYRLVSFLAALEMGAQHPLTGVGPGTFGYQYYDYKMEIERNHPSLFRITGPQYVFAETHSDHLQVLAETGVPGYLLFAGAIVFLGSLSFRRRGGAEDEPRAEAEDDPRTKYVRLRAIPHDDPRTEYVRLLALPLAVSFAVLTIAQFPLQLVAPTLAYLWAAAPLVAWGARQ